MRLESLRKVWEENDDISELTEQKNDRNNRKNFKCCNKASQIGANLGKYLNISNVMKCLELVECSSKKFFNEN